MGRQYTLFELEEIEERPTCGNCENYSWVKYYGGRYQKCSRLENRAHRPYRPKAGGAICPYYKRKE